MTAADLAQVAFESVGAHRLRSGLTLLAVGIGVTAVLLLTALGEGAKRYVVQQFASAGANLVIVMPGRTTTGGMGSVVGTGTKDLTLDDADAVARRAPEARRVAPVSLGAGSVEWGSRSRDVYVVGTTADYAELRDIRLASGRFLTAGDPRRDEPVVVLGATTRRELFGTTNPVGQSVRVAGARFRVIGVMQPKGVSLGVDMDDIALVPVASALRVFGQSTLHRVMVQARSAAALEAVREQVRDVLTERHREEDFTLVTSDAMLASFGRILDALTWALAGIAAISLAVAGIGIMNVMLVAVSERVGEIGLLKALGAEPATILRLFVAEAVVLTLLGLALGAALSAACTWLARTLFPAFPVELEPRWLAITAAFALAAGTAFGWLPARRAARLEAADALRAG